jgi:PEP-CTERM motif
MNRIALSTLAAAAALALAAAPHAHAADYTWTAASGLRPSEVGDLSRVQIGHTHDTLLPGGPLRMVSNAHAAGSMAYMAVGDQIAMPALPELSFTARIAEFSQQDPSRSPLMLGLTTAPVVGLTLLFKPTSISVMNNDVTQIVNSAAVDTTQFHDYRLTLSGPQNGAPFHLYVDGVQRLHGHLGASGTAHSPTPRLWFGDTSFYAGGVTEWLSIHHNLAAVPEPQTWAMLALGLAAVGMGARRRSSPAAMAAQTL